MFRENIIFHLIAKTLETFTKELTHSRWSQVVQVPTGVKEYATICEPCGPEAGGGDKVSNSYGVAARRVDAGGKPGNWKGGDGDRGGKVRTEEDCVTKVKVLCRNAGVTARMLGACKWPVSFCNSSRRRRKRSAREKQFVGGKAWPEKEEGLKWRSSLPRRRGRRIPGLRRRKGLKKEEKEEEEVLKCNCKRVEVGERMEERQVICCSTHHFTQNQANKRNIKCAFEIFLTPAATEFSF